MLGALFDWDGVVIDSHDQHERAWQEMANELGQPLPDGFFKVTFGLRNEEIIPQHTTWADENDTARIAELGARKEEMYRELIRRDGIEPLPGVRELLDDLCAAGVPCAVGSSSPLANIEAVLEIIDLRDRFAAIVAAEDVTRGKPAPDVFLEGARRIAREPAHCVVLEDAHAGIEAGRNAGMRVIGVATTHAIDSLSAADLAVPDLTHVDATTVMKLTASR